MTLMEGGFGNAVEHPQFGFASPSMVWPDMSESSVVQQPSGPMWAHTYSMPVSTIGELTGVNPYGVVFDDGFSGIFEVDNIIDGDEPSDWDGIYDESED